MFSAWDSNQVLAQVPSKPQLSKISSEFPYESKFVKVLGSRLHYVERGNGDPILFLHGIPTSSYLWRNVIPWVEGDGRRVIAVDLIGFGKSDKPDINYGFFNQARYLEAFIAALDLKNVTLVVHDWGAGLGQYYAWRHLENVKAIAYMEAALPPVYPRESYASFGPIEETFRSFRDPQKGPKLLIDQNFFVERIIPSSVLRDLSPTEMEAYRKPFATRQSRQPIYDLIQTIPIEGQPNDTWKVFEEMAAWWRGAEIPKLVIYASPGRLTPPKLAQWAVENLKNVETAFIGYSTHFLQEDNPEAIGRAISDWYRRLPSPERAQAVTQPEPKAVVQSIINKVRSQLKQPDAPFALMVQLQAKPQFIEQVAASYAEQVRLSRGQRGNIAYDFNLDASNPTRFVLYERWTNLDAFIAHETASYTLKHFERVASMLEASRQLHILEPGEELTSQGISQTNASSKV